MHRKAVTLALAVVPVVVPASGAAQYVVVPGPAAYALQGVTVVQADGRRQEDVTIVVRGSLIESVGRNVTVPADAELLEGDSLVVYPGFVDGDGKAAHEFPSEEIDRSKIEIWNAPRSLQGYMPSRRVVAHLTADGEAVAPQRRAGIVAAAVHPGGAMMGGRGALLLYRADASRPEELVLRPELGPRFEFRGGPGVYPGTLFGVMAFYRQSFEDARHGGQLRQAHERDPRGLATPAYDADHAVLEQVMAGEQPVYFVADAAADILRVIGLADEYAFKPVIVGGGEAWKVADALKRRNIPVLVSLDFGEPRRWKPASDTGAAEPLDAAAEREKRQFEDRYANAGRLAAAGVTFALTSGGTGSVLEGARKAVRHGLSEEAALAALTRTPAQLFGVPHVSRVEAGLPATFVVASGPLFGDETRIAYTFVEGRKEDGSARRAAPAAGEGDAETAVSFGGVWEMSLDAGGQMLSATMTIRQDGATFSGTLEMQGTSIPVREGVIDGDRIRAVAVMTQGGQTIDIRIEGTVEGDRASGEADAGPLGVARWTARRTGPGGAR